VKYILEDFAISIKIETDIQYNFSK